jgi:hypothetical protein
MIDRLLKELPEVDVVIVHIEGAYQQLVYGLNEWREQGGWLGFLKKNHVSIRQVKTERARMSAFDFAKMGDFAG